MTLWVAGPVVGQLLGDLGADVIKVELPDRLDPSRGLTRGHDVDLTYDGGKRLCWEAFNRNKRAIALDIRKPRGLEIFQDLVESADVFLTNMRPPALRRLNADEETLRARNPRLVYALAEGLGSKGPRRADPVNDPIGMAYSGYMYISSESSAQPYYPPGSLADVQTGTMLAFGILAALMMRGQDGQGRTVRSSQLRSMLWLANYNFAAALNLAETFPPFNQEAVYNPLLNLYKCSDGKWVTAGVAEADKYWDLFCNTIGAPHLSTDPTLRTLEDRYAKRKELIAELSKIFATRTRDEWLTELRSAGLWAGPVFTVDEVIDDEHVQAEGSFKTYSNGTRLVTPPFDIEGWSPPVTSAPEFGGSTDEVLRSLGISEDELSRLRIDGVIW